MSLKEIHQEPPKSGGGIPETPITRRNILLWMLATSSLALLPKDTAPSQSTGRIPTRLKGLLAGEINGNLFPETRIYGLEELADIYIHLINKNVPYYVDKSLVSSMVYHGVDFFTSDKKIAKDATKLISSTDNTSCGGELCTYDTTNGVAMEIATSQQVVLNSERQKWISSINALAHESYHMSVRTVEAENAVEDYGVLGTHNLSGRNRGFWHESDDPNDTNDTISQLLTTSARFTNGHLARLNTLEELFSEWGKTRLIKRLTELKRLNEIPEIHHHYSGFPMFNQTIVNLGDSKWQTFFNGALSASVVDNMHLAGDRYGLLFSIGDAIKRVNPTASNLSRPDTAALGLVSFADFAQYNLSNHRILFSLSRNPVIPNVILEKAREVISLKAA